AAQIGALQQELADRLAHIERQIEQTGEQSASKTDLLDLESREQAELNRVQHDAAVELEHLRAESARVVAGLRSRIDEEAEALQRLRTAIAELPVRMQQHQAEAALLADRVSEQEAQLGRIGDQLAAMQAALLQRINELVENCVPREAFD